MNKSVLNFPLLCWTQSLTPGPFVRPHPRFYTFPAKALNVIKLASAKMKYRRDGIPIFFVTTKTDLL